MKKENKNVLTSLRNPKNFLQLGMGYLLLVPFFINNRYKLITLIPSKMKTLISKLKAINPKESNVILNIEERTESIDWTELTSIQLADRDYPIYPTIRFDFVAEDDEVTLSLHRWNWLLTSLINKNNNNTRRWGFFLIRCWVNQMGLLPPGLAGESYSVGERISNGIMFSLLTYDKKESAEVIPIDIAAVLKKMVYHLSQQLEFNGDFTGNHIINNARALFLAGEVLNIPLASELALKIFEKYLPRLITKDGFLREGSAHYQLLFTRWLLEVLWISNIYNNHSVYNNLKEFVPGLIKCSKFFIVLDQQLSPKIPIIGDISPDFRPDWLLGVVNVFKESNKSYEIQVINKGWFQLWKNANINFSIAIPKINEKDNLKLFTDSGWYRIDKNKFTMFWHVDPLINELYANHSHNDALSFVLFKDGSPLIIDAGRLNYNRKDCFSLYGLSTKAHNSLTIDEMEPFIHVNKHRFPYSYRRANVEVSYNEKSDSTIFSIIHNGFSRLYNDKIIHRRDFIISADNIEIVDKILGKKQHIINWFFHFNGETLVKEQDNSETLSFNLDNNKCKVSFSQILNKNQNSTVNFAIWDGKEKYEGFGWKAESYGQAKNCITLDISSSVKLPVEFKLKLSTV